MVTLGQIIGSVTPPTEEKASLLGHVVQYENMSLDQEIAIPLQDLR